MCPRKFVTGSAQEAKVYNAGPPRRRVKTKVVRYKCGCEVILGDWQQQTTGMTCEKHGEPIEEVVTRESFIDP